MISYDELIKNLNILLVDDDEDFISIADVYLKMKGYNIDVVTNGKDAVEAIKSQKYQIMLIDYFMPDMSGEEVINVVREFNKQLVIILQTGFSGQKPPIEMMQKLNIQNYHDKTEGMDKLNLEIISAIKVFNQQNEISISKYRTNAIGKLISSIAGSIKSNLMSIAAGLEITNMLANTDVKCLTEENAIKLNNSYINNKLNLEKIDKVLTAIIKESSTENNDIMSDTEIVEIVGLILNTELISRGYILKSKSMVRTKSYISGSVNDIIFIICEFVLRILEQDSEDKNIEFILTEDENNWYFKIENEAVPTLDPSKVFLFKNIVLSIENAKMYVENNDIVISLKKN